ncbi:MAG: LuxR C-terminal-related transcriptional regulator, partial [Actinomycetota bacterium]
MLDLQQQADAIVGRSEDIRRVVDLVGRSRLVSLVGSGGVGKTALATEVLHELEPDFDRLVVVELADGSHDGDVARLIADAVIDEPARDMARVAAALDSMGTLLVLDNCEHLVDDAADALVGLLDDTEHLRVLVTSRRPIDLSDEVIWTVRPLAVPERHATDEDVLASPAAQLLLERIRQSVPTFELGDGNRVLIADICRAADGVPLVIELAAALARTQPLSEILRAMTERPAGLSTGRRDRPEHQRSVAASLDWSRQFLSDADADLLDRLTVFVGGFTAEAARCLDPAGAAEGLARLVDHSLVAFDPENDRYRILEIVRLEAANELSDEARAEVDRCHHEWALATVDRIHAMRWDADPDNVFPGFRLEVPNLCTALRRCVAAEDQAGFAALLGPIALWWVHYLPPDDPGMWWDYLGDDLPLEWRANLESGTAFYWSHRGQHRRALEHAERAKALHDEDGDLICRAMAEQAIGNAHLALGDVEAARAAYEEALSSALASGHPYPELLTRVSLARLDPDDPAADRHLADGLAIARTGFGSAEALIASELGVRATRAGRHADARRLLDQAVDKSRTHGYAEILGTALCGLGELALAQKDGSARPHFEEALHVGRRICHDGLIARAQAGLVASPDPGDRSPAAGGEEDPLSERELAVARLLRGDLTQRDIADELYIAPSTVKTHIKSIYRKLG